ncbi:MAG: hypothetical protein IID40_01580, partial [Planctomycetes bacterium]|nr:hypothetical protein [Planctomycetota bacterium]
MRSVRLLTIIGVIAAAGWWLFADTVAHHRGVGDDPTVIRFAHFGTYQDYRTWQRVIIAFERHHPGLRVRQEYVVGPYGAYNTKLRQQMLSKTLPQAFLVQFGPFAHLAHPLADLTELV